MNNDVGPVNASDEKVYCMKTMIMTLGAVALTAISFNALATDPLFSPRAATVQVKTVPGLNNDANRVTAAGATIVPRALGAVPNVAGVNNEINPVAGCRNMTASPKLIAECAATPGMPGCKVVADAKP